MAKFESPIMAIRKLRRQGAAEIPERHTSTSIYQRFLENGSVEDRTRSRRPSTITEYTINEVEEALNREPQTSLRKIAREMNISKDKTHRIIRDIIGFKPYMMKICIYVWKW
jgi:transposase